MADDRFDIHVSFESDGHSREVTAALLRAFEEPAASVAPVGTISHEGNLVTVHFHELEDGTPPAEGPSALIPIARALIAVSAARQRAGLPPRQHITIEVEPSPAHTQAELRHDNV